MYQLAFPPPLLASFLPWLMLNRDGLSILLHPGTDDAYANHIDHAVWLGSVLVDERSAKVTEDAVRFLRDGHRVSAKCSLVLPEIEEPLGRKFAISNRMLDVLVAEMVLQRPSIHALIGQLEPS
jgi:Dopa 4,5-dioxygenase family protein